MYRKGEIDVISLGCSKNLVESEMLLRRLENKGYNVFHDPDEVKGEYVVVNTCGFISDAKEESIDMILNLCELKKKKKKIGNLVVMGCLSQRYLEELKKEIPEVDYWFGKFDWTGFIKLLPDLKEEIPSLPKWERKLTTPSHSAYLKISEGCNRFCAFCAIPLITGRHHSRPIDEILDETRQLVSKGVKEFNIIAQDLSSYGLDLYGKSALASLIDKMADIKGVEWIRLHYAYPADFPEDILEVIRKRDNVCNYLDIALQHISDPVLKNMRRNINKKDTLDLIKKIREKVPEIRIRTTLMVGFPGEGDKEFEELMEFVRQQRFDRMGAFTYSEEDDTFAAKMFEDSIPQEVKQKRLDRLMEIQQEIASELNSEMVGKTFKVLIDRIEGEDAIGRTQYDSPEIDPEVIVKGASSNFRELHPGDFINVKILDSYPFELIGERVD